MTPPILFPNSSSPSSAPTESPEVQTAQEAYRQAGFTRNRAEQAHTQAVKDHGDDSPEAKAAKADLVRAQKDVEAKQKELSKALGLKPAPKPAAKPAPKPAPKSPPQPDSGGKTLTLLERSEFKAVFLESSSRIRTFETLERELRFFDDKSVKERIQKLLDEAKKNPKVLEKIKKMDESIRGESIRVLEKLPEKPKKEEQPKEKEQAPKAEPNS